MNFLKYKNSLIIFGVYCIFWVGISIAMSRILGSTQDISPIIPFKDPGIEIGFISLLLLPISSLIGTLIGGFLMSPIFLSLHIKIFRNKYQYGIYPKPEYKKFKYFSQGLFSALMAINISLLLLNPDIVRFINGNIYASPEDLTPDHYTSAFVVLLIITLAITNIFFSPTWFLMDSGILYSNKMKLNETNKPLEIRSIGRWYEQLLKGYAGVSVLIAYINFIVIFFGAAGNNISLFIITLIMFIPLPIILIVPTIPALILIDVIKQRRNNNILKMARKRGITDKMEVSIELIKGD
ncbi:MAG: hypothetical protein JSV62_00350 [Promethearchaeota archaeon]|nr:MAG: hypothetical protein JSV62_00350 [Candidatus Lokiarchaeota archaeon]